MDWGHSSLCVCVCVCVCVFVFVHREKRFLMWCFLRGQIQFCKNLVSPLSFYGEAFPMPPARDLAKIFWEAVMWALCSGWFHDSC